MAQERCWYSDTEPKALEVFLERRGSLSAPETIEAVFALNRMLWNTTATNARRLHPRADDREIVLRVAARRLDRGTMRRVYDWYPPEP